ncbi:hypothetical protein BM1_05166 [Bipolaris maydis]|nr:hypothetical protein BM1_05166 [Bipolaris maydis]
MPGHLGDVTDVRTRSNEDIRMDGFHYLLSLWSTQIAFWITSWLIRSGPGEVAFTLQQAKESSSFVRKSTLGLKEESSRSLLFSCEGDAGGAIALLSSLSLRSELERGAYYFEAFVKGLNLLLDYL